jgi:predicted TPR repeat methyltransferase
VLCVRGLQALQGKFPSSSRVARLEGMQLVSVAFLRTAVIMAVLTCGATCLCAWQEQRGEFAKAEALYNELLEANPANNLVAKRKIAVLKAQKRTHDVIAALNEFLRSFGTDQAAVRPDV